MELHPEVRNILPELQEVDFQRSRAHVFRARVALGSQDWGATCKQKQLCVLDALCIAKKNNPNLIYMHMLDQICHVTSDSSHMVLFNFL